MNENGFEEIKHYFSIEGNKWRDRYRSKERIHDCKMSISSTFYVQTLFQQFFYVHVTSKKLPKQRSYKKFMRKMLMKLTAGVNFIHVVRTHFLYEFLDKAKT